MVGTLVYALGTRTPFELDIERDRGRLYQMTPNDTVINSFTLKMMNMSQDTNTYILSVDGLPEAEMEAATEYTLNTNEMREIALDLELNPAKANLPSSKTDIEFVVVNKATGKEVAREESRFIAPRG